MLTCEELFFFPSSYFTCFPHSMCVSFTTLFPSLFLSFTSFISVLFCCHENRSNVNVYDSKMEIAVILRYFPVLWVKRKRKTMGDEIMGDDHGNKKKIHTPPLYPLHSFVSFFTSLRSKECEGYFNIA